MEPSQNTAVATARAFATYAMVPYLGILFCPGAVVMGSLGLLRSCRRTQNGGRRSAYLSVVAGLVLLSVQLLLWWILYRAPEWAKQSAF